MSLAASSFADGKEFHLHTTSLGCRGHTYACATTSLARTHGKISSRRLVNENRRAGCFRPDIIHAWDSERPVWQNFDTQKQLVKRRRWTTVWTTVWTDGQDQESWTSFVKVAALSAVSLFPAGSIDCSDDKHFWYFYPFLSDQSQLLIHFFNRFMLRSVLSVQGGIMSASIVEKISNLRGLLINLSTKK